MSKILTINIAIASFFVIGAILIGVGIFLLAPSGEQSKLCYNLNDPSSSISNCP